MEIDKIYELRFMKLKDKKRVSTRLSKISLNRDDIFLWIKIIEPSEGEELYIIEYDSEDIDKDLWDKFNKNCKDTDTIEEIRKELTDIDGNIIMTKKYCKD